MHLQNVHRTFTVGEVDIRVLRGIDLAIHTGELLIIKGESGSGKSTLLNMIGGIDKPTQGSIIFDEQDISTLDDKKITRFRRNYIGFVFQFYNLVPTLTALENVATATEIAQNPINADKALALVGLTDGHVRLVKPEAFTKISSLGVEEQRVAVKITFSKGTIDALRKSGRSIGLQYQVRVRIITDAKKKAFLVPRTVLFHGMNQQWQLYRVSNKKAVLTDVEIGLMNDYTAEIVSGVQLGETVIIAPESSIRNGHKVTQVK